MISGVWFADENIINFGALSISHIQMYSMLSGLCCFERIWGLGLSVLGWGGFEHIRRCCWQILLLRNSRWPRPSSITTHSPTTYKLLISLFLMKSLRHMLCFVSWCHKTCPTSLPLISALAHICETTHSVLLWAQNRHCLTMSRVQTLSYDEPSTDSVLRWAQNWLCLTMSPVLTLSYDEPSTDAVFWWAQYCSTDSVCRRWDFSENGASLSS